MSVDQVKAKLKELSQRRSEIEAEIATRAARLETAEVGMHGSLVDKEGFPRADIDIPAVRTDRHQVIVLSNDHKALTSQMDQLLQQLHSQVRQPGSSAEPTAAAPIAAAAAVVLGPQRIAAAQAPQLAQQALRPFAVVDEVSPASPASQAGIQLGDQLCDFGGVTADTPSVLQQVAATLQANEGRSVQALFLRHGALLQLQLVPQQWGGRGLLGCHLRPL